MRRVGWCPGAVIGDVMVEGGEVVDATLLELALEAAAVVNSGSSWASSMLSFRFTVYEGGTEK